MGAARYLSPGSSSTSFSFPLSDLLRSRNAFYLALAVAALSALSVFVLLCARDHSLLVQTSASVQSGPSHAVAKATPVISAESQPAPDTITRVTVPTEAASQPATSLTKPKFAAASAVFADSAVAHNHAELLTLEKHSNRQFVEFSLPKTKRFLRVGLLTVGLWKADRKHNLYDVAVFADGRRVDHKHVSLYSPLWISTAATGPVEFVVNEIDRNAVAGYISQPKTAR